MRKLAPRTDVFLRFPPLSSDFDCQTLFLGAQTRPLIEAHNWIVRCFSRSSDPAAISAALAESEAVRTCYEIRHREGKVSVALRDALYRCRAEADDLELEIRVTSRRGTLVEPLTVRRLSALGTLLPELARGTAATGGIAGVSADDAEWTARWLARLEDHGDIVAAAVSENRFRAPDDSPRVRFLGHSSLLLQHAADAVLVDPLLRYDLGLPRAAFDVTRLPLQALVCTHAHWDHCDPQTYLWFDKRIPVVVPRVRDATALNPPVAPMFIRLGFKDVREIEPWQRMRFGSIELTAVPFFGEQDEPGEHVDHFTYAIRAGDLSLYGGVDIFRDSFGEMPAVLERVRAEHAPNVAFLPCSDVTYRYADGGGNRFCRFFDAERLSQTFRYTASASDAAEWAGLLGVRVISPYALFLFSRWSTHRSVAALGAYLRAAGQGKRFWPLRPLDSISMTDILNAERSVRRRVAVLRSRIAARFGAQAAV